MYKLFIDDERYPVDDEFIIARSFNQAIDIIKEKGLPEYASFDHDLGLFAKTGADIAYWITDYCQDNKIKFTMQYYVHSQNPVGKKNIEGVFESYKRFENM